MKIILTSIGTRGDMEPFLSLGEILKEKGHEVTCLFPEQFRDLATDAGLSFESLGTEFMDMLDSPAGRFIMSGGKFSFKKLRAYLKLISVQKDVHKKMVLILKSFILKENPDRILHSGKVIYPVIWSLENKNKTILITPVPYMHYVRDHAHLAFNKNFGPFINKLTYKLTNYGLIKTIIGSVKHLTLEKKITQKDIRRALFSNKAIYTISPSLFKRPEYWEDNLQVLGYHERKKSNNWEPSTDLLSFLVRHDKILFITFGSMINQEPEKKTAIILKILEKNKIPAIINTASGGLVEAATYDKNLIHFVSRIPYDWIFPKMHAVIHHGGSGTTHTSLKYACCTMILPHIIDQYVWNKIVHQKGTGPLGIDVSKISVKNLEPKVIDLMNNKSYKEAAQTMSDAMMHEQLKEAIYQEILKE